MADETTTRTLTDDDIRTVGRATVEERPGPDTTDTTDSDSDTTDAQDSDDVDSDSDDTDSEDADSQDK